MPGLAILSARPATYLSISDVDGICQGVSQVYLQLDAAHAEKPDFEDQTVSALHLGLQLFEKLDNVAPVSDDTVQAAVLAARQLFELSSTDASRLAALQRVLQMARSAPLQGRLPANEAHWLVANAHNAGCSARARREEELARGFMQVALDLATATGCKGVAMDSCRKALESWGLEQPVAE